MTLKHSLLHVRLYGFVQDCPGGKVLKVTEVQMGFRDHSLLAKKVTVVNPDGQGHRDFLDHPEKTDCLDCLVC